MRHSIILIGFMGCGKSSLGKFLAKELNFKLIDTDKLIEKKVGKSIKDIFASEGETFFREQERALALELKELKNVIIATGGGFHQALIKGEGQMVVFLKASFDFLKQRLSQRGLKKRPLFADELKARALFDQRQDEYKQRADCIIDVEHMSLAKIKKEILKEMQ